MLVNITLVTLLIAIAFLLGFRIGWLKAHQKCLREVDATQDWLAKANLSRWEQQ